MNTRSLLLTSLLVVVALSKYCDCYCGYCIGPQIDCLQKGHKNHNIMWKDELEIKSKEHADKKANEKSSFSIEVNVAEILNIEIEPSKRICYTRMAGNFIETCSMYMKYRDRQIQFYKNRSVEVGCAINRNKHWIVVCCLYKLPKEKK